MSTPENVSAAVNNSASNPGAIPAPPVVGAERRRGPFRPGDKVQLTDSKGRMRTITLRVAGRFHTHRGYFDHSELLGRDEGTVMVTSGGQEYLALRPLLADYVLSMPRGAAVIYPKDAAQIITMADIYPGARVVEAGVGSGALTLSLLRAVGEAGQLLSIERREDFAQIAQGNVKEFFGELPSPWQLEIGDFSDALADLRANGSVDRIVLDMLAPWEHLEAAYDALVPGGVLTAYVATTTQLSRFVEDTKAFGHFTEPAASETLIRNWHLDGLSVRPDHRMVAHTGFLVTTRALANGVAAPARKRRPAPGAHSSAQPEFSESELEADMHVVAVSPKKLRKAVRTFAENESALQLPADDTDRPSEAN